MTGLAGRAGLPGRLPPPPLVALRLAVATTITVALVSGCAPGTLQPIVIDTANDACHRCRMIISDPRLAAQVVAAADEPLLFDDVGCLRDHLAASPIPADSIVYVADHRSGEWVAAHRAVYTRAPAATTPMGAHVLAHADVPSRDADPLARGGEPLAVGAILGPSTTGRRP